MMTNEATTTESSKQQQQQQHPQLQPASTFLPAPAPPVITAETLQYRLDTGNIGKHGGQRGSLTRCAQKYGTLQFHLLSGHPDAEDIEASKQDLVRELELFELEMNKLILYQHQLERQLRTNEEEQRRREGEIASLTQQVRDSTRQARVARETQACFAEYESLARIVNENHPTSVDELQYEIDATRGEVAELEAETNAKDKILKVREAQYQLLLQYMMDLKRSVDDDANDDQSPMEVEDNLYGDL
jgi:chromosome segregation ATPase